MKPESRPLVLIKMQICFVILSLTPESGGEILSSRDGAKLDLLVMDCQFSASLYKSYQHVSTK